MLVVMQAGSSPAEMDAVCQRAGSPLVLDYVRLNIDARKPEGNA